MNYLDWFQMLERIYPPWVPRVPTTKQGDTMEEFDRRGFREYLERCKYSRNTIDAYTTAVARIHQIVPDLGMKAGFEHWLTFETKDLSPRSVWAYPSAFSVYFEWKTGEPVDLPEITLPRVSSRTVREKRLREESIIPLRKLETMRKQAEQCSNAPLVSAILVLEVVRATGKTLDTVLALQVEDLHIEDSRYLVAGEEVPVLLGSTLVSYIGTRTDGPVFLSRKKVVYCRKSIWRILSENNIGQTPRTVRPAKQADKTKERGRDDTAAIW